MSPPPGTDDKDRGHLLVASLRAGLWSIRTVVEVDKVRRVCACLVPEDEEQVGTLKPLSTPQAPRGRRLAIGSQAHLDFGLGD